MNCGLEGAHQEECIYLSCSAVTGIQSEPGFGCVQRSVLRGCGLELIQGWAHLFLHEDRCIIGLQFTLASLFNTERRRVCELQPGISLPTFCSSALCWTDLLAVDLNSSHILYLSLEEGNIEQFSDNIALSTYLYDQDLSLPWYYLGLTCDDFSSFSHLFL